jgi:DNA repair exonuclease SbcCD ATPase subunit
VTKICKGHQDKAVECFAEIVEEHKRLMQAADREKLRAENLFKSLQERVESLVNLPEMVALLYEELTSLITKTPPHSMNSTNEIFAAVQSLIKWTNEEIESRRAVLARLANNMVQLNKYCNGIQALTGAATVAVEMFKVVINNLLKELQRQLDTRQENIINCVLIQTVGIEAWTLNWTADISKTHSLALDSRYGVSVQWRECVWRECSMM